MPEVAVNAPAPAPAPAPAVAPAAPATSEPSVKSALAEGREFMGARRSTLPKEMAQEAPAEPAGGPTEATPAPPEAPKADDKPAEPLFTPPNWLKKDEKALFEGLSPEKIAEIKPFLAPFERQDKEREKGVQKYLQGLGPLQEIAKDPASVGFTRLFFENQPLLQAADKLAQAFITAQQSGKAFDPASVFGGQSAPKQGAYQAPPDTDSYIASLAKMTPEDREMEIAAKPGKMFDVLLGALSKIDSVEASVSQKLEPVAKMGEQAALQERASREMDSWFESLPAEIHELPEDQYLGLMGEVADIYQEHRDAWLQKGHTPISAMDLAFEKVMAKREIAKAKQATTGAEASKEAALRATRTDNPTAGSASPAKTQTGSGMAEALAAKYSKRNAGF